MGAGSTWRARAGIGNLATLSFGIPPTTFDSQGKPPEGYVGQVFGLGDFLVALITFVIVAFVIFVLVKVTEKWGIEWETESIGSASPRLLFFSGLCRFVFGFAVLERVLRCTLQSSFAFLLDAFNFLRVSKRAHTPKPAYKLRTQSPPPSQIQQHIH